MPVVAIAMPGSVYEKVLSNAQEAKARDSRLIGVTFMHEQEAAEVFEDLIPVPVVDELLSSILTVIPLQLLAYHIAAWFGRGSAEEFREFCHGRVGFSPAMPTSQLIGGWRLFSFVPSHPTTIYFQSLKVFTHKLVPDSAWKRIF